MVRPGHDGLAAVLIESEAVNYRTFGAVGDGHNDDGVQIKRAHEFANEHDLPVVQLSGEFWISRTNDIPIRTNVHWGKSVFHIDEKYNSKYVGSAFAFSIFKTVPAEQTLRQTEA